jgi:Protein of unknown function (DUF3828)
MRSRFSALHSLFRRGAVHFRRNFAAVIFCAFVLASAGSAAAQVTNQLVSSAAAVQAFLQYDMPGHRREVFDYKKPTPLMRRLLSKSLVDDWFSAMRHNSEFPVFDGNPFDGMQGSGGSRVLAVSTQSDDGEAAVVTATLSTIIEGQKGRPHQQKYVLKKEDGAWKIDEIVYDTATEPVQTLHAYLKDIVAKEDHAPSASTSAPALAQAPSGPRAADLGSGKYCIENGSLMLLTRPGTNGSLEFGLSSWNGRGNYFEISGSAQPDPGGWRFRQNMNSADPTERCEATIARLPDGGYSFSVTQAGPCESSGGYGAAPQPYRKILFPARSRQSGIPRNKSMAEAMSLESGGISCDSGQRKQ